MLTFIIFIATLAVLVLVHEFGHFIAAKLLGVEVTSFAFGFPPTLLKKKKGETTYKFNLIPFGGYVTLRGEGEEVADPEELKNPKNLQARTPLHQVLILISGVIMNVGLALFLLWIVYLVGFVPIYSGMWNHKGIQNNLKAVVQEVEKDSPADKDGIKKGDVILSVDGKRVYLSDEVVNEIRSKADGSGAKVNVEIKRGNEQFANTIETYKSSVAGANGQQVEITRIGVIISTEGKVKGGVFASLGAALSESVKIVGLTFQAVFDLFKLILTRLTISSNVAGPVGIYVATSYFASLGFVTFLQFIALLSLSLAVFNILPIPALDGGHVFIILLEKIAGKKFSTKTKNVVALIGFSLLILLVISVTFKNVIDLGLIPNIFKR